MNENNNNSTPHHPSSSMAAKAKAFVEDDPKTAQSIFLLTDIDDMISLRKNVPCLDNNNNNNIETKTTGQQEQQHDNNNPRQGGHKNNNIPMSKRAPTDKPIDAVASWIEFLNRPRQERLEIMESCRGLSSTKREFYTKNARSLKHKRILMSRGEMTWQQANTVSMEPPLSMAKLLSKKSQSQQQSLSKPLLPQQHPQNSHQPPVAAGATLHSPPPTTTTTTATVVATTTTKQKASRQRQAVAKRAAAGTTADQQPLTTATTLGTSHLTPRGDTRTVAPANNNNNTADDDDSTTVVEEIMPAWARQLMNRIQDQGTIVKEQQELLKLQGAQIETLLQRSGGSCDDSDRNMSPSKPNTRSTSSSSSRKKRKTK